MSRMTEKQLAKAFVVEQTIENTRRYLFEGRCYAEFSDDDLTSEWIEMLRDLARTDFSQDRHKLALLDLESELGLRGIAIPYDQVQPELALFAEHVQRRRREGRPDPADCPEARVELADLRARLSRPKH